MSFIIRYVLMIWNYISWRLFFCCDHRTSSIMHWFLWISRMWQDPSPDSGTIKLFFLQIYTTSPIVVVMIVKRSISSVYLFSSVDKGQFLSKDLSSPLINSDMINFGSWQRTIRCRHSYGSVLLISSLLDESLTLVLSALHDSMIFYLHYNIPCMISSRSLRQIPSNIHHDNIFTLSSRESDVHNLQLLHDVDQCNLYLP